MSLCIGEAREKVRDDVGPWVAAQVCHGVAVMEAGLGCLRKLCSSAEEGSVDPS